MPISMWAHIPEASDEELRKTRIDPHYLDFDPPIGPNGQPVTRKLTHYEPTNPIPAEPVRWKSTAPCPRSQITLGTRESRFVELVRGELKIEDVKSDYEIMYMADHNLSPLEIYPAGTLVRQLKEHPPPKINPKWKGNVYWKKENEDFIWDPSKPTISKINALAARTAACTQKYAIYDLVEKGREMLHELKFHVQGREDWGEILWLEARFIKCLCFGLTKDTHDPREWEFFCRMSSSRFITDSCINELVNDGIELDRRFSILYGVESSELVKHGEPLPEYRGYKYGLDAVIDWGKYREPWPPQALTNGHANGHVHHGQEESEVEQEQEIEYTEEEDEEEKSGEDQMEETGEDDDSSELEEVSAETWREASEAREASLAREVPQPPQESNTPPGSSTRQSSSDIEIKGSQIIQPLSITGLKHYDEEDEGSQISAVEGYSQSEDDMDYDEEGEDYEEQGEYDEDDYEDDVTMRPVIPESASRTESEFRGFTDDESRQLESEESHDVADANDKDREGDSPMRETVDDESIADSDELQILEEHHLDEPTFDDNEWQEPTTYAITAAEQIGVDPEQAEEVFDEQGRPYDEDLVEGNGHNDMLFDVPERPFVPDSMVDLRQHQEDYQETLGDETEIAPSIYEPFPLNQQPEGAGEFALEGQESRNEMVEMDPALTKDHGFADLARRAMLKAGAEPILKTSDASGLSSPPSSQQTDNEEEDRNESAVANETMEETQTQTLHADSPMVEIIQETPAIDPALMTSFVAEESQPRPTTADGNERPAASQSSQRSPTTPRGRRSVTSSQDITPFRKEHPRSATGVVIPPGGDASRGSSPSERRRPDET